MRFAAVVAFSLFAACTGEKGPAGEMGDPGTMGTKGDKGDKGDMGDMGGQGLPGSPGVHCWDLNSDGQCTTGEDVDNSGTCDPADCTGPEGPQGQVGPQGPQGPAGPIGPQGATGPQGLQGPPGPVGPAGANGATGPAGPTGPAGATGATGPAGPQGPAGPAGGFGLQKRTTYQFTNIAAAGQPAQALASITFTPTVSGTAHATTRGYCNMMGGTTENTVNIAIAASAATAFPPADFTRVGVINLPANSIAANHQLGFTAEQVVAATAGVSQTLVVAARHELGTLAVECRGSFTIELVGTLP